jgi:hypothetical protein
LAGPSDVGGRFWRRLDRSVKLDAVVVVSSTKSVLSQRTTARWITFSGSQNVPGRPYDVSRSIVLLVALVFE